MGQGCAGRDMFLMEACGLSSRCHVKGDSSLQRSWGHPQGIEGGGGGQVGDWGTGVAVKPSPVLR